MLRQGGGGSGAGGVQGLRRTRSPLGDGGRDRVDGSTQQRGVRPGLLERRLHVHAGELPELRPGHGEPPRHAAQPRGQRLGPCSRFRHVPAARGQQRAERPAGQVHPRVVLVGAQLVEPPDVGHQGAAEHVEVDPVARREPDVVDAVQGLQGVAQDVGAGGHALGGQVVEQVVETVVPQRRGGLG